MTERNFHTVYLSIAKESPREADILQIAEELRDSSCIQINQLEAEEDGTTVFYPRPNDRTVTTESTTVFQVSWSNGHQGEHPYQIFSNRLEVLEKARQEPPLKK